MHTYMGKFGHSGHVWLIEHNCSFTSGDLRSKSVIYSIKTDHILILIIVKLLNITIIAVTGGFF